MKVFGFTKRIDDLEARVAELEQKLQEKTAKPQRKKASAEKTKQDNSDMTSDKFAALLGIDNSRLNTWRHTYLPRALWPEAIKTGDTVTGYIYQTWHMDAYFRTIRLKAAKKNSEAIQKELLRTFIDEKNKREVRK